MLITQQSRPSSPKRRRSVNRPKFHIKVSAHKVDVHITSEFEDDNFRAELKCSPEEARALAQVLLVGAEATEARRKTSNTEETT